MTSAYIRGLEYVLDSDDVTKFTETHSPVDVAHDTFYDGFNDAISFALGIDTNK